MNDKKLAFIVDDRSTVQDAYKAALEGRFNVMAFASMEAANEKAGGTPPDVLLADIKLETIDKEVKYATEFLQKIREGKTKFDRYIPVVLFTDQALDMGRYRQAVVAWATDLRTKGTGIPMENPADVITPETAADVLNEAIAKVQRAQADRALITALKKLRSIWGESQTSKLVALPVGDGTVQKISLDDIIKHVEDNDELGQALKAGLGAFYVSLLAGEVRAELKA